MIIEIVNATVLVLTIAIIARSLLSFFIYDRSNPLMEFLITVTEPILGPLRRVMPRMGMFDLSPMVAILLLQYVVRPVLISLLSAN
jgi:YggT family protein